MRTLRAYSLGHLLKTVELVEDKIPFFGTLLPKTVDFTDFISLFMKVHSFGHSVFGRLPRDLLRILLGSLGSEASEGLREPAPEAGRLLPWIRVFFSTFLTKKSEIKKKEKKKKEERKEQISFHFHPSFLFFSFFLFQY